MNQYWERFLLQKLQESTCFSGTVLHMFLSAFLEYFNYFLNNFCNKNALMGLTDNWEIDLQKLMI